MSLPVNEKSERLWSQLLAQGYVNDAMPSLASTASPWYVRLLIGFSGWFAAAFILGFLQLAFSFIFHNDAATILFGLALIFLAYVMLQKKPGNDFFFQFALASSFAGQILIVASLKLFQWFSPGNAANWLLLGLFMASLAWFIPASIHRVWSAFAAVVTISIAFSLWNIHYIQTAFIMLLVAITWLNEFRWVEYQDKLKPIGYGLTLALLYQASTGFYSQIFWNSSKYKDSLVQPWVAELFTGMVLLYVVFQLFRRTQATISKPVIYAAIAGVLILIFASLKMYGITVGVMVILLGYANANRILTGLGIFSLLTYISTYYYSLHTTLLIKSQSLLILGLLLLLASWLMRTVLFSGKEK